MRRFLAFVLCVCLCFFCSASAFAASANEQDENSYATFSLHPFNGENDTGKFAFYPIGYTGSLSNNFNKGFVSYPAGMTTPSNWTVVNLAGTPSGFNASLGGGSANFTVEYDCTNTYNINDFSTYYSTSGFPRPLVSGWSSVDFILSNCAFDSITLSSLPSLQVPAGGSVSFLFTMFPVGISLRDGFIYSSLMPATNPDTFYAPGVDASNTRINYFFPASGFEASAPAPGFKQYSVTTEQGVTSQGFTLEGSLINSSSSSQPFGVEWFKGPVASGSEFLFSFKSSRSGFPSDLRNSFDRIRFHFGVSYSLLVSDASGNPVTPGGGSGGGSGCNCPDYTSHLIHIAETLAGTNTLLQQHLPEIVALLNQLNTTTGNIDSNVKLIQNLLDSAVLQLENMAGTLTNIRTDTAQIHALLSSYLHYLEDISGSVTSINEELKSFHADFNSFMNKEGNPDNALTPEQQESLGSGASSVADLDSVEDGYFNDFSTSFDGLGFNDFVFSHELNDGLGFVGAAANHLINSNGIIKTVLIFPIFLGFIKAFLNIPRFAKNIGSKSKEGDE